MKVSTAIIAGVTGAVAMSAIMFLARMVIGMPANLEMMLGTAVGLPPGEGAWVLGFVVHVFAGAVIALVYAWLFENFSHRAGWVTGLVYGAVHTVLSGLFLGVIPFVHPLIPEAMNAPGIFMANLGATGIIAFAALHLIYGAIVGGMYGQVLRGRVAAPIVGPEPR